MAQRKVKIQSETARNWDSHPKLTGVILQKGVQKMPAFGDRDKIEEREYLLIASDEGHHERVYKNAALADLFKAATAKDHVELESLGTKQTANGRPFRVFTFTLWSE
jgi:hypothetical protein